MATPTYTPIASITLGSSASSVTFSSIPQDYRDLVLVVDLGVSSNGETFFEFNSDTGSNYSRVFMRGDGSSATSSSQSQMSAFFCLTGDKVLGLMQIMDYSATDKHKTSLIRFGNPDESVQAHAQRYASTSAITEMKLTQSSGNYNTGSTFSLFGIAS